MLYLAIYMVEISEFFSTSLQTSVLQDLTLNICVQNCVFFLEFGTCVRNRNFEVFLVNIIKTL